MNNFSLTSCPGAAPGSVIAGKNPAGEPTTAVRKFRVLIADDEADARMLIGIALDQRLFELAYCVDGKQAIELCSQAMPDLAIVDIQMPHCNGMEVCKWIKEHCSNNFVPVLLLTCQSEVIDKVTGLSCGADDYITKPFAIAELAARVQAFLRIKTLADQLRRTQNLLAEKEKELVAMQVAGAAAHELGQPLTSIVLNCELLGCLEKQAPAFEQTLKVVISECSRIRKTLAALNSLEQFSVKPYAGSMEIADLDPDKRRS